MAHIWEIVTCGAHGRDSFLGCVWLEYSAVSTTCSRLWIALGQDFKTASQVALHIRKACGVAAVSNVRYGVDAAYESTHLLHILNTLPGTYAMMISRMSTEAEHQARRT
jgi:hypothetical protein